jgi:pyrimidine-nucleoside phosphorylase
MSLGVTRLIERKRDGGALSLDEWTGLIRDYAADRVPDYQMAALMMAVFLNGLQPNELDAITDAMLMSGGRLSFADGLPVVDKHSTGGVGDKVSLVLAPLLASCGVAVPMMSGRGLGHTGGTLDKLEAIPGFRTDLSLAQTKAQVERIGCAMIGQTPEIAPADRKLYALRDVTATVEAIPLIAASIMSKKLAEGLTGLVLDVKWGSGAFLPDSKRGLELAKTMISLGEARGCPTVALMTAMDRPLGHTIGNALETEEALLTLRGEGPDDLVDLTLALGVEMLQLAGVATDSERARSLLEDALGSGRAAEKFGEVIEAQGGNAAVIDDPALLPQTKLSAVFTASQAGFVAAVEPRALGRATVEMGGGRRNLDDVPDLSVGFSVTVKPGNTVTAGQPIATVYANDPDGLAIGGRALERSIRIGSDITLHSMPLVSHRVTSAGVGRFR